VVVAAVAVAAVREEVPAAYLHGKVFSVNPCNLSIPFSG
jgi:hypothetical protein